MIVLVAVLACLCLAHSSLAEPHTLRAYTHSKHNNNNKEVVTLLASIEERLRVVDTISIVQAKQTRRLDVIQDKLDRLETTIQLKLERAQLAAERLEHKLHMLQSNTQASIKENTIQLQQSQENIENIVHNLTSSVTLYKNSLDKVNDVYEETSRRGLVLETLMRDGLAVVNATRRELADGLRVIARRHGNARVTFQTDIDAILSKKLNENNDKMNSKVQEILDIHKRFVESCQRIQQDDPTNVADVLDKLIDSLINVTTSTFRELQNIQNTIRTHDIKVMKLVTPGRLTPQYQADFQNDLTCKKLENAFHNASFTVIKEKELQQLTDKFIALTDRADAALQKLEAQISDSSDDPTVSDITAAGRQLILKLGGIKGGTDPDENKIWEGSDEDITFFDDDDDEPTDTKKLSDPQEKNSQLIDKQTMRTQHQRHLHNHPYDRGPS